MIWSAHWIVLENDTAKPKKKKKKIDAHTDFVAYRYLKKKRVLEQNITVVTVLSH